MLQNWGVIAAALAYIGFLFFVASYGDRLSQFQRERAGGLIYPLSLAIYCTSWTFFGSVGFASRTSFDFLAIYVGPMLMIASVHAATAAGDPAREIAKHHLDRRLHRRALRQEPEGRGDRGVIAIVGSVPYIALQLKAVASSLQTILGDDQSLVQHPDRRRHRADRTLAMAAVHGAVRHPPGRRHRASARPDAGGGDRVDRQAGGVSRRRHLRHLLDVQPGRADRARDEDAGGGAGDQYCHFARQFPDHDRAVVLRLHAAAASVPRQRGRELQRRAKSAAPAGCFRSIWSRSTCS